MVQIWFLTFMKHVVFRHNSFEIVYFFRKSKYEFFREANYHNPVVTMTKPVLEGHFEIFSYIFYKQIGIKKVQGHFKLLQIKILSH